MNKLHISLDLGRVVINNSAPRIPFGKTAVYPAMPGCLEVLQKWNASGHKLSVISKIDHYHQARVTMSLVYNGILPHLIDPSEIRYCHERREKGPIAAMTRPDVHVDDRIEPMNAVHAASVPYKILFTGISDDRIEHGPLDFDADQGLFVAQTWSEVEAIVASLSI